LIFLKSDKDLEKIFRTKAKEVINVVNQFGAIEDFVAGGEFKKMTAEEYGMVRKLLKGGEAQPADHGEGVSFDKVVDCLDP
jgi:hypothetical protein